jgi:class 3 adenylate cyclase
MAPAEKQSLLSNGIGKGQSQNGDSKGGGSGADGSGKDANTNASFIEDLQRNAHLLIVLSLLVSCLGLVITLIVYDVLEYQDLHDRKGGAEFALIAGNGLLAINAEIVTRLNGNLTYVSTEASLIATMLAASTVANQTQRDAFTTSLVTARAASALNYPVMLSTYTNVASSLLLLAYAAITTSAVESAHSHLGLLCLGSHLHRLAAPLHYMSDYVRPSWQKDQYLAFLGSLDEEPCGELLPETLLTDEEWSLLQSAPGLIGAPNPATYNPVIISRNAEDLTARGQAWAKLFQHTAGLALDAFDDNLRDARIALGTSCAACVLVVVMLGFAPFLSRNTDSARSDIRNIFRTIEATVKLMSKYIQVLHSCSVREGEWTQLQNSGPGPGRAGGNGALTAGEGRYSGTRFLWRVIEFVQRVRPYLSQSSFGDIENVPITGQSGMVVHSGSVRMDAAAAAQAIRELRLRDLRPDMGMQIVAGTVMCLSLAPFHREADAMGDDATQDLVRNRMSAFIGAVERCVNGTTGVIHSVCGDNLIALWNVTSSTSSPRVAAIHSALQLVKSSTASSSAAAAAGQAQLPPDTTISIGITQSFLLAGNIEIGNRKQLAVCGPAIALAEKLEGCNAAHRTSIMVDQGCAEAISTVVIADVDFAVRPVVLIKLKEDSDDFVTGYAVYAHRIRQERLKAWNALFKDLGAKLQSGALVEVLLEVEEYTKKHAEVSAAGGAQGGQASGSKQRSAGGSGGRNTVDRSAESWKRNIAAAMKVRESSQQMANEFGV